MSVSELIHKRLLLVSSPERAIHNKRFFKTGKGEYGEGDTFLGTTVPEIRKLVKEFNTIPLTEIESILTHGFHEERLLALLILADQSKKGSDDKKKENFDFYISHISWINNWDLVDSSAEYVVGLYLENKPREVLKQMAVSSNIWEKRIAIISTFSFIKKGEYEDTFSIAELLLSDSHDLIHKATGWMLREVGKRCGQQIEEEFLKKFYNRMPRTMLRYALELFPSEKKKMYMKKDKLS